MIPREVNFFRAHGFVNVQSSFLQEHASASTALHSRPSIRSHFILAGVLVAGASLLSERAQTGRLLTSVCFFSACMQHLVTISQLVEVMKYLVPGHSVWIGEERWRCRSIGRVVRVHSHGSSPYHQCIYTSFFSVHTTVCEVSLHAALKMRSSRDAWYPRRIFSYRITRAHTCHPSIILPSESSRRTQTVT